MKFFRKVRSLLSYLIVVIILLFNEASGKIDNLNIFFVDSSGIKRKVNDVMLHQLTNDTLFFSRGYSCYKIPIQDLISLQYTTVKPNYTGAIIGASVGLALAITTTAMLNGRGFTGHAPKINGTEAIPGILLLGTIGGIIGGIIQGKDETLIKINFRKLPVSRVRERIILLIKAYDQ